ncbi:MAG: UDP-glucose 4-epimerase, partial [uncultured Corynebacteriales bacterium]
AAARHRRCRLHRRRGHAAPAEGRPRGHRARRPLDRARGLGPGRGGVRRGHAGGRGGGRAVPRPVRRRAALRGEGAGRRVDPAPRAVLADQRGRQPGPAGGDAGQRGAAAGVLLHRRHVRRAGRGPDRGDRADPADQPVRGVQARGGHDDHLGGAGARPGRDQPALLQRGRRLRAAGRAARHRDAHNPHRAAGGQRPAADVRDLRRRLPDPGRHLHPGLRARRRPGRRPPAGPGRDRPRRAPHLQPGQRRRLLRARRGGGGAPGHRAPGADRGAAAPRRRPGGAGRLQRPDPGGPGLGPPQTDGGRDGRRRVGVRAGEGPV